MNKNINFDPVVQYYDTYVQFDYDLEFWKNEIGTSTGYVLELMCGSGRISIPLIHQGVQFYALDYSKGLLGEFEKKLNKAKLQAEIIHADARHFKIRKEFDCIFIGCHSLSEILENKDKLSLLKSVCKHLTKDGKFVFSLHNPAYKLKQLTKDSVYSTEFDYGENESILHFTFTFLSFDEKTNIVQAKQEYQVVDSRNNIVDSYSMGIAYHLIPRKEIENLLELTGFKVSHIFGDYQGNHYEADRPFMIYRCVKK